LRFAVDPDGNAVPDLKSRLPGRGVWLTCARDIVEKAAAGRTFDRAFRRPVNAGENLAGRVDSLLERDALQRLSLANKAGLVICGFEKVSKALREGKALSLVHASDATPDGCRKLGRVSAARQGGAESAPEPVRSLNCEQLSLALGRPNVIHAALKQGGPADKFLAAAARLEQFRAGSDAGAAA
jgi:hypothetical protein